jgi:hypothetical protein
MKTWTDYVAWVEKTAQRRWSGTEDDKAELLEIWGLGVGEELLEMLAEIDDFSDPLWAHIQPYGNQRVEEEKKAQRKRVLDEASDYVYYLARIYLDTGNARRTYMTTDAGNTLRDVCKHACRLVGTIKKTLRANGREGVSALTAPSSQIFHRIERLGSGKENVHLPGRREEIRSLLDLALSSFERWLLANDSSLGEVTAASVAKIEKKIADGKFDQVRSRLEKGV